MKAKKWITLIKVLIEGLILIGMIHMGANIYITQLESSSIYVFYAKVAVGTILITYLSVMFHELGHSIAAKACGMETIVLYMGPLLLYKEEDRWRITLNKKKQKFGGRAIISNPEISSKEDIKNLSKKWAFILLWGPGVNIILSIIGAVLFINFQGIMKFMWFLVMLINIQQAYHNLAFGDGRQALAMKKEEDFGLYITAAHSFMYSNSIDERTLGFLPDYIIERTPSIKEMNVGDINNIFNLSNRVMVYGLFLAGEIKDTSGTIELDMEYMFDNREELLSEKKAPYISGMLHYVVVYLMMRGREWDAEELFNLIIEKVPHNNEAMIFAKKRSEYLLGNKKNLEFLLDENNIVKEYYKCKSAYNLERAITQVEVKI